MAMTDLKRSERELNMKKQINVNDWIAMFRDIGLDQAKMQQWHSLFEARHPVGHQDFLEWLGLKPDEIDRIRAGSK
jgi:hypothetical protein